MTIKTIVFNPLYKYPHNEDCVVLKRIENGIVMSFPFHEDTPNFYLSVADALTIRNAIDELLQTKLLPLIREEV